MSMEIDVSDAQIKALSRTFTCGITWILAVNLFHCFASLKIPIPNSLGDSLLHTSVNQNKSIRTVLWNFNVFFFLNWTLFSDLTSPCYQVLGKTVSSMRCCILFDSAWSMNQWTDPSPFCLWQPLRHRQISSWTLNTEGEKTNVLLRYKRNRIVTA